MDARDWDARYAEGEFLWTVTGVDFSPVGLDKARWLASARDVEVTWVEADVLTYEPPLQAFELVAVLYLHLNPDDLAHVLGQAVTALIPGGTLLVVGHSLTNLTSGVGGPQMPDILYTKERVEAGLAGLTIDRSEDCLLYT